jgi:isopentenyl diphosphate isomerase/L-lactate dehydrogenase-like FMN-dependent dehydrogenase
MNSSIANRRNFLRFLAGSPLFARAFAQEPFKLSSPKDVLAVTDLEEPAHRMLPPAHWGYVSTGVDDDLTLKANIGAFKHIQLKPRRLVDVSKTDTRVELFGATFDSPIYVSAVGGHRMFHPEGELATARAANAKKTAQMLSTQASTSVEDVAKALGRPPWYQLYIPSRWDATERLVRRVEAAGCSVLFWTVDGLGGRNIETSTRLARLDTRNCSSCHEGRVKPMLEGIEGGLNPSAATWEWLERLKKMTKMKVLLKGLDNREDARQALEHGADGIVVSNHGGRAAETLRPSIECLPEVVDAVGGRIPVFVDGGFRRGSDVFKALALGARAVGIGRPYVYGLTVFGQPGVERVLEILNAELQRTMRQCGTPAIAQITRASLVFPEARP